MVCSDVVAADGVGDVVAGDIDVASLRIVAAVVVVVVVVAGVAGVLCRLIVGLCRLGVSKENR